MLFRSSPHLVLATVDLVRWHQRLGHTSSSRLSILQQQGVLGPVPSGVLPPCSVCPLAKQSALPFPTSTSSSSAIFDFVHLMYGAQPLFHSRMVSNIMFRLLTIILAILGSILCVSVVIFLPFIRLLLS